jgi:type II secretory pathway component PulJ
MTALIAWFTGSRLMLAVGKWVAIALTISLFLLSLRRSGERARRLVERLENMEKANEIQRRMLKAAARRPHNRDELTERLRDGQF